MATQDNDLDRPGNWDGKAAEARLTMGPPFLHTHGGINHAGGTVPETHDTGNPAQDAVEGRRPREAPPYKRTGGEERGFDVVSPQPAK